MTLPRPTVRTLVFLAGALATGNAFALVSGTSGSAELLDQPTSLVNGASESARVQVFDEAQDVEVSEGAFTVDYLFDESDLGAHFTGVEHGSVVEEALLPAGTYDSHLIHFDPPGAYGTVSDATIEFDGEIVAVIVGAPLLRGSDATFAPGVAFQNDATRRAEPDEQFLLLSETTLQVLYMVAGGGYVDEVRVLTRRLDDACLGYDDGDDADADGVPDGCDDCAYDALNDADADGLCADVDNCADLHNPDQLDLDADTEGDVCDEDRDGDGVEDVADTCPMLSDPAQADADGDGIGDLCDTDVDGDGVLDDIDACADTEPGAATDTDGCSADQLCPCTGSWRNHGAYVACVTTFAQELLGDGLITDAEKGQLVSGAAGSTCGKPASSRR